MMEEETSLEFHLGGYRTSIVFSSMFPQDSEEQNLLIVQDENTAQQFPQPKERTVVIPSGEGGKSGASVEQILDRAFQAGLDRSSLFQGIGGGVVCDVTAFAASLFMRGSRLRLVPTTLLAMVDAAFGGKTAINFHGWKNMVGTFYPAEQIWINPRTLESLPKREFFSGMAEVIKSAMLRDPELFSLLEHIATTNISSGSLEQDTLTEVIRRSLGVKAWYVTQDLTEQQVRVHLNLGHTFAHGLESATRFEQFTHGEAVAWGLYRAIDAGLCLGITGKPYAERVRNLLKKLGYKDILSGIDPEAVLLAMQQDKKKKGRTLRFILQKDLCNTVVIPLEEKIVREILLRGLKNP